MVQYTENNTSVPSEVQNIVANDVALLEQYCLMQTGQYEWTALITTIGINKTRKIVFTRNSNSYNNNYYTVTRYDNVSEDIEVTNEYYVFSNMGYGKSLSLPVYDGVTSWSLMIISCTLMFAIVFKGVLFKCLDRKRR